MNPSTQRLLPLVIGVLAVGITAVSVAVVQRGLLGQVAPPRVWENFCGFNTAFGSNIARGCTVKSDLAPNYTLAGNDFKSVTDGAYAPPKIDATGRPVPLWVKKEAMGWLGKPLSVPLIIDLGKVQPIEGFSIHMAAGVADVYYPSQIQLYTRNLETDAWQPVTAVSPAELSALPPNGQYSEQTFTTRGLQASGRFVKLVVVANGNYVFTDEVEIFRGDPAVARVPNMMPGLCRSGAAFQLGACLNSLIEATGNTKPLKIIIGSGSYSLAESVLLFERSNIQITGTTDAQNKNLTTVTLDSSLAVRQASDVMQFFTFNIVNSSNIAISNLNLNNGDYKILTGQRGVTACATAGKTISNITMRNVTMRDFSSFNTLFGNTLESKNTDKFVDIQAPLLATQGRLPAGEGRLYTFFKSLTNKLDRDCSGAINTVIFDNNTIYMRNVGFYVAPYSTVLTSNIVLDPPNYRNPGVNDWRNVMDRVSATYFGFIVQNNRFLAVSELTTSGSDILASAIKTQNAKGIIIQNNVFDSTTPGVLGSRTYAGGAAINLASGSSYAVVTGNTINLPANHPYKAHGIAVPAYFQTHIWYGIGAQRIFGGTRGIVIMNNKMNNAYARIFDCCSEVPLTGVYCTDADAAAADPTQAPEILMQGNYSDSGMRDADLVWLVSVKNKAWVDETNKKNPGTLQCRTKVGISFGQNPTR